MVEHSDVSFKEIVALVEIFIHHILVDSFQICFDIQSALEQAHNIVWQRNRERGVWLVGNLFRQSVPKHEIFLVIHTVFEARTLSDLSRVQARPAVT